MSNSPRRLGGGLFNENRPNNDAPTPDLKTLLPKVATRTPQPAAQAAPEPTTAPVPIVDSPQAAPEAESGQILDLRTTRSKGGRPRKTNPATRGTTAIPARVPADLYEQATSLVKGEGKPSWGQIVAWTCMDHPAAVTEQIRANARQALTARIPRGSGRTGKSGVQISALLNTAEHEAFTTALEAAQRDLGPQVTATQIILAALQVALQRAPHG